MPKGSKRKAHKRGCVEVGRLPGLLEVTIISIYIYICLQGESLPEVGVPDKFAYLHLLRMKLHEIIRMQAPCSEIPRWTFRNVWCSACLASCCGHLGTRPGTTAPFAVARACGDEDLCECPTIEL